MDGNIISGNTSGGGKRVSCPIVFMAVKTVKISIFIFCIIAYNGFAPSEEADF